MMGNDTDTLKKILRSEDLWEGWGDLSSASCDTEDLMKVY